MLYKTLGNTAINGEAPAGRDIAYETEFEELQQEIDKMSSITPGTGPVDWNKVEKLAAAVLAEKSKHLLVAVYLVKALMQTRRLDGWMDGTQVLKDMIAVFWDNLYPPPKRKKGRLNALQWWFDQTEAFFRQFDSPPLPAEKKAAAKALVGEMDSLMQAKLGDDALVLRPLLQLVDNLPEERPEPEKTAEAANEPRQAAPRAGSQPTPTASKQPAAPPEGIESDKDANRVLKAVLSQMNMITADFRETNPANPLGYRLNRLVAWLTVDELPLVQEDGHTLLPPPEAAVRSGIENQLAAGNYEAAIAGAESQLRQSLFWFDLSRFTAQALEALGGKYAAACEMVGAETTLFLKRLPGIENQYFSDGTPFADSETRAWLKTLSRTEEGDPLAAGNHARDDLESGIRDVEAEAGRLLKKKEKAEALALLQTKMVTVRSARERFLLRMALARLFIGMGKHNLATPQVEEILNGIDDYGLETWDPDLAVQGLMLAYENAAAVKDDEKGCSALSRIVKINPVTAFRMAGKGK